MKKDLRKLLRQLTSQGWRCEQAGGGHLKLFPPDKSKPMVTLPISPGDHRSWKNTVATLRRSGAAV